MAHDQGSELTQPTDTPKINRRRLLGNTAKAIAGTAVAIPIAREVKQTMEDKVETNEGIFYPLYEVHGYPIENLPDKIDVYWREGNLPIEFYDPNRRIARILYEKKAKVAFGDVDWWPKDLSKDQLQAASALISASLMGLVPTTASLAAYMRDKTPVTGTIGRRAFLGGAAATAFAATGLNLYAMEIAQTNNKEIRKNVPYIDPFRSINIENPSSDVLGKATIKLQGLISDFHPEIAIMFFRNAVWAHKLIEYSKKLKDDLKRKPNFALAIGASHGGVEEFLIAGQQFIETCISAYPKEWLSEVIKTNGGIEKFSQITIDEPTGSDLEWSKTIDTFVDEPLEKAIEKNLA